MMSRTVPSMAFSSGTNPRSTSPLRVASSTSASEPIGTIVALGVVGLTEERLLGEGALRAEECDPWGGRGRRAW